MRQDKQLELVEALHLREESALLLESCSELLRRPGNLTAPEFARLEYLAGCACESLYRFNDARVHFEAAGLRFEQLGLARECLSAELGRIYACRSSEPYQQVLFEAERCLQQARGQGWRTESAEALVIMASAGRSKHRYQDVITWCQEALSLLIPEQHKLLYSRASTTLAWALAALGRYDEADAYMSGAFEVYRGIQNHVRLRRELGNFAFQAWCRGEVERARVLTQEQHDSAQRDGDIAQLGLARFNLAVYETHVGNWEEARRLALLAWQRPAQPHGSIFESATLMLLGLQAVHLLQPAEALNYLKLSEGALRDTSNDEADLLDYYMTVCLLANGAHSEGGARWRRRRELKHSVENQIEVRWLLRALELLRAEEFMPLLADNTPVQDAVLGMIQDLQGWQTQAQATLNMPAAQSDSNAA